MILDASIRPEFFIRSLPYGNLFSPTWNICKE